MEKIAEPRGRNRRPYGTVSPDKKTKRCLNFSALYITISQLGSGFGEGSWSGTKVLTYPPSIRAIKQLEERRRGGSTYIIDQEGLIWGGIPVRQDKVWLWSS